MSSIALPDKQFFKIGEAADIVGVKTHVLRYWESEFPGLRPMKTRGSHRMYRRVDVELACLIRRLLHQEGYTIPGAKKRVREFVARREPAAPLDVRATRELGLRAELIQIRADLASLLDALNEPAKKVVRSEAAATATVTAVVPKTVLIQQRSR
jgi:DNA-binding transcriptional MerR regulator